MKEKILLILFRVTSLALFLTFIGITVFLSMKIKSPEQIETLLKFDNQNNVQENNIDKKVRIIVDNVSEIMTGLYPQYRKLGIPLISIEIENPLPYSISVYMESEIVGLSYKTRSIEIVKAKDRVQISQYPQLINNIQIKDNNIANLHYIVKIDGRIVSEQSIEVTFVPRDVLFWGYLDSNNKFVDTSLLLAGWVTPNIPDIRQLLRNASFFHPEKSLYGYQLESVNSIELRDYARTQVKAIYDCLRNNYEIHYVNTPVAFTPKNIVAQRINLPSETLSRGIANCIDSTVLFASAMESIGMNPYIVILPGHSLLAWSINKNSNQLDFLDVTYVSDLEFDEAINIAYERLNKEEVDFSKAQTDKFSIISIKDARKNLGIDPIE